MPQSALTRTFIAELPNLQRPFQALATAGPQPIAEITVDDVLHRGLRGLPTLITNVSTVCRERGLIFRGRELPSLTGASVLELLWMGITAKAPTSAELDELAREFGQHALPEQTLAILDAFGPKLDPILAFSHCYSHLAASLEGEDTFRAGHGDQAFAAARALGHVKRIVALSLPLIGAIYSRLRGRPQQRPIDWSLGWGSNLCRALDLDEQRFARILEIHGIVHLDQGKGNPSSHVSHVVATTGADPYRCVAASLIALSCPSHAFAGIGVLDTIDELHRLHGPPTREQVRDYLITRLRCGERVYGIGQAVMKNLDTRFACLHQAAAPLLAGDPYYQTMAHMVDVMGEAFAAVGKHEVVPHPNVNMVSSLILCRLMGVDRAMLPLLFAASRIIGNLCQYIENLILPGRVCRPLSHTTEELSQRCQLGDARRHRPAAPAAKTGTPLAS
ncbi:citrate/2-methylcitrate synthase [Haliangium ochraceum]|uniref:citrate synthase (unknown stereospecificity) n=1 Tax=Haliangium ochraceum (strain DSM 14365 / JCM 11303 / SMP-2) TaxID=502025 RepID=D0LRJ9_HALO1|nr:citrate/2-methylcitrate synthase [Haliangium ochraceum]ACY17227.1 Citrate synthase [Haliangium ochraceum DSM 14365]